MSNVKAAVTPDSQSIFIRESEYKLMNDRIDNLQSVLNNSKKLGDAGVTVDLANLSPRYLGYFAGQVEVFNDKMQNIGTMFQLLEMLDKNSVPGKNASRDNEMCDKVASLAADLAVCAVMMIRVAQSRKEG